MWQKDCMWSLDLVEMENGRIIGVARRGSQKTVIELRGPEGQEFGDWLLFELESAYRNWLESKG